VADRRRADLVRKAGMLRSVKLAQVFEYPVLERFWRDADDLGFHGIWDYDHFYGMRDAAMPTFDGWSMLAAMAKVTTRARIGCMVTGVTYRHPAILAKMAVSVDHISGGRLELGIGAGSHEGEHDGYGIPFPPAGTRIDMLEEACEMIRRLWTEPSVTHRGRFWTLSDALANPKPVQERVPMVIGGTGERRTLGVVARRADEWNFSPIRDLGVDGPPEFARLSAVLDDHCAAIGRDPKEIRRSVQVMLRPDDRGQVKESLRLLEEFERAGAGHAILGFASPPSGLMLQSLAAV
jgi:F420-dependent oxidoreductase-like protein